MNAAKVIPLCIGCSHAVGPGRPHSLTGAEELRKAVGLANNMRESFNDRFTATQLVTLWRALHLCLWDVPPDEWAPRQVREALDGIVPRFRQASGRARSLPCGLVPVYAVGARRFEVQR